MSGSIEEQKVERRVRSVANPRGLDVKSVERRSQSAEGDVYDIVFQGEDVPDDQNTIRMQKPSSEEMSVFGERIGRAVDHFRSTVLGHEVEIDRELEETEEQLDDDAEDVEYGPGPIPDTTTLEDRGYADEYVQVQSTSEIDIDADDEHEVRDTMTSSGNDAVEEREEQIPDTSDQSEQQIDTEDLWGRIADTALEARRLEGKGHDVAAEALLTEIEDEIESYRGDNDD